MKKNAKVFMVAYIVGWLVSAVIGTIVYLRWLKEYTNSFKRVNKELDKRMKDKFILSNDDDIWDEEQKKHILEWREVSKNLEGITKKYYSE